MINTDTNLKLKIQKITEEYKYFGIDESLIEKIITENIKQLDFQKIIKDLNEIIETELKTESNSNYLNNYINNKFNENKFNNIKVLVKILNTYKKTITIDHYLELLKNNKIINLMEKINKEDLYKYSVLKTIYAIYKEDEEILINDENINMYIEETKLNHTSKVLTREEEIELIKKIKKGDKDSYNKLFEYNQNLIKKIAKKYANNPEEYKDYIQEGNIGLMIALARFELEKKCKLSTYAVWWIKREIIQYKLNSTNLIRISTSLQTRKNKIEKIQELLTQKLQREPTIKELSQELNISEDKIKRALNTQKEYTSLYTPINENEDHLLIDAIKDDKTNVEEVSINNVEVEKIITLMKKSHRFKERDIDIILRRNGFYTNGIPETMKSIGLRYNVTRMRIMGIEKRVYEKIREELQKEYEKKINPNKKELHKKEIEKTIDYLEKIIDRLELDDDIIGIFPENNLKVFILNNGCIKWKNYDKDEISQLLNIDIKDIENIIKENKKIIAKDFSSSSKILRLSKSTYRLLSLKSKK